MISVSHVPTEIPMNKLHPGESGTVKAIHLTGAIRRRMQDIGLIRGTPVRCVSISPLGDPAAYRIRGAVIAIRGDDSGKIYLERQQKWD